MQMDVCEKLDQKAIQNIEFHDLDKSNNYINVQQ
ncbi:unnamed protein product [Paramecium sonneborni]|uniref:Uncharacterized protein n=1 Tax=Paramecium sonneborni TaxID=65129 RepID=A0A8S1RJ59_9CILI|nr:unnamed protein product [Paramecium sonneborni]